MKAPLNGFLPISGEGERKNIINSELWHACAGPLASLPPVGSLVVYFPQGHSEQVAASMQKETSFIPNYPNLPSKLICMLHNVTLHADLETDEVYAQMTLQPVKKYDKEALLASEMGLKQSRQPAEFFCKTLTASDTSTHGGFSVPRRAAEKIFPPLDYSMQPPAQELVARDLHDTSWTFRHIFRGQPKRHLLTSGWSVFVSTKRLLAGDSVVVIRDEKTKLLMGIKRANRQQPALSSSVISSDSMHIGILAAAAHAAANNSPFTIFYNPRASPSEFVIPLSKYNKAMYTQVSIGMRFRMMFETEESSIRRYMGTITGISDLDPVRWKNSQWRNLQVGWDESAGGERPSRVSIWDTEPVVNPFYIYPPPFFRLPDSEFDIENASKRTMPWLGNDFVMKDAPCSILPGMSIMQWMNMQQNNQFPTAQSGFFPSTVSSTSPHNNFNADDPSKLSSFQPPVMSAPSLQFNKANAQSQVSQCQQPPITWPQQQQLQQLMQNPISQQQLQIQQELQQLPQRQQLQQQQPQQQSRLQQQQHQQIGHLGFVSNAVVAPKQVMNQSLQQPVEYSQLQQQQMLVGNTQTQQSIFSNNRSSLQLTSMPQDSQFQQQTELQACLLQRQQQQAQMQHSPTQLFQLQESLSERAHQVPQLQQLLQLGLSEQQLQLQLLQKLQQQQKLLSPANPLLQPQLPQQQQPNLQNQQVPLLPSSQHQSQQLSINSFSTEKHSNGNSLSTSALMQSRPIPLNPLNQAQRQHKPFTTVRAHSGLTEGDAPSCSTSPSTNNCQVSPSNLLSRNHQEPALFVSDSLIEPASNIQDMHCNSDIQIKQELSSSKGPDQVKYRSTTDQLEASSSGTLYCMNAGTIQPNFPIPTFGLDGDVQLNPLNNHPLAANIDGLAPDTFLFRGYDSQKDLQNLLSSYGGTPRDIETDFPNDVISSQSFGVPSIPLKPGCSSDMTINEAGVFGSAMWASQTQRMRTYTKVQKRGSVGRCIDVNHYKGYDELMHDLALMFGVEGQLQDPQRNDWKLVYVDHENDILLVGDDPWEEFVSCVQSIKILSSAEVEQMSLDGDLGHIPGVQNQACRL